MKEMKRFLSLIMALTLLVTGIPALGAAEEQGAAAEQVEISAPAEVEIQAEEPSSEDVAEELEVEEPAEEPAEELAEEEPADAPVYTLQLNRESVKFGEAVVGGALPKAVIVKITNTGNADQTISMPKADAFRLGALSAKVIKAGETAVFNVVPKDGLDAGTYVEKITIASSEGGSAVLTLSFKLGAPTEEELTARAPLASITGFYVSSIGYKDCRIKWNIISGETATTKYQLYRSEDHGGPFTLIATLGQGNKTYKDSGLQCGKAYYYRMRAVDGSDYSPYTSVSYTIIRPSAPLNLSAQPTASTKIEVKWNAVSGASGYEMYRTVVDTGVTKRLGIVNGTSFVDSQLTAGIAYLYYIRAYRELSGVRIFSDYSDSVIATAMPVPPRTLNVSRESYNSIKLSWSSVSDAESYKIYRSKMSDSGFNEIATVSETSYIDTNLLTGVRYYYYVATVANNSESEGSEIKDSVPVPIAPREFTAKSVPTASVRLSWRNTSVADGYDGYIIKRSDSPNGVYTILPEIVNRDVTSYLDETVQIGHTYYYSICGYTLIAENSKVEGSYTVQVVCSVMPDIPKGIAVLIHNAEGLNVLWSPVADADGYMIYCSNSKSDGYKLIADIPAASVKMQDGKCIYRDYDKDKRKLTTGTTYYYKVLAYTVDGSDKIFSEFSAIGSGVPKPTAPENIDVTGVSYNSVSLKWDSVYGAQVYMIYGKAASGAEGYTLLKTVTKTAAEDPHTRIATCTVTGLKTGVEYAFKVSAYRTVSNKRIEGATNVSPVRAKTIPETPSISGESVSLTEVKLTWKAVGGASGYEVSTAPTGSTGAKTVLANSTALTVTPKATPGREMDYYVRAYALVNGVKVFGPYSAPKTIRTVPPKPSISSVSKLSETSLRITWKCDKSLLEWNKGGGFTLERSTDGKNFIEVHTTNFNLEVLMFDDSGLSPTVMYYYRLCAYASTDYGVCYSKYSDVMVGMAKLGTPEKLVVVSNVYDSVKLSWTDPSASADGYEVYYKAASEKTFVLLGDVAAPDTNFDTITKLRLEFGTAYEFKVRSYKENGSARYYSDFTDPVNCRLTIDAPIVEKPRYMNDTTIRISWFEDPRADEYHVYYSTSEKGTYTRGGTVKAGSPLRYDVKVTRGVAYYLKVCSAVKVGGKIREGEFSTPERCNVKAPTQLVARVSSTSSINFTWNKAYGVAGYKIYRRPAGSSEKYTKVADNISYTQNSYTLTKVPIGVQYEYAVRGFIKEGTKHYESSNSNTVIIAPSTPAPKNFKAARYTKTVRLSWDKVTGATGYYIRYQVEGDTSWTEKLLYDSDSTAQVFRYADIGAITGEKISFRIASFYTNPNTGKRLIGPSTGVLSIICP